MKYVILEAMEQLAKYEEEIGRTVPKPMYLFVQKYGRTMESVLQETAEAFGKKKCFSLRKEMLGKDSSLLDKFLVETQKRSDVGKQFDGFVLVELSEEETEKERISLYEYIKKQSPEISCMFTVRTEERADAIQKELEQQFPFVRTVYEECYSSKEQKEILLAALEQGGGTLTEAAENRIEEILAEAEWKTTDHVENKLRNLANNLVYEQIMKGEALKQISEEELQEAVFRLAEKRMEKITIGFALPTVTKEYDMVCPETSMFP